MGPNEWNKIRFEAFLEERLEITTSLPDLLDTALVISSTVKIYPVEFADPPLINTRTEILHGPFWTFANNIAVASYQPLIKPIKTIKSQMLSELADKRWRKETEGTILTLQDKLIWVTTQRNERDIFLQAVQLGSNGAAWKLIEVEQSNITSYKTKGTVWLTLTTAELQQIVSAIVIKVQSAFDWENNLASQINSAATIEELNAIVF